MAIQWSGLRPELPLQLGRGRGQPLRSQPDAALRDTIRSGSRWHRPCRSAGYWCHPGQLTPSPRRNGSATAAAPPQLVLGFGNVSERAVESGIAAVADLLH